MNRKGITRRCLKNHKERRMMVTLAGLGSMATMRQRMPKVSTAQQPEVRAISLPFSFEIRGIIDRMEKLRPMATSPAVHNICLPGVSSIYNGVDTSTQEPSMFTFHACLALAAPADWQTPESAHLKNIRQVTHDFVR